MVKNILCWFTLFLLVPVLHTANGAEKGKISSPQYRSYVHNYPHPVPPDYVYRTGRIFSPKSWLTTFDKQEKEAIPVDKGAKLVFKVKELASQLLGNAGDEYGDDFVLTVTTFVNLNNLYQTSAFGRYFSEQLISELQLAGVRVIDIRKSPGLMISESYGEYGMSRDMDELSYIHSSQAMLVGTYTFVEGEIFINARILRNPDGMVVSSASLVFGLDSLSEGLLADEGMPVRTAAPVSVRAFPVYRESVADPDE